MDPQNNQINQVSEAAQNPENAPSSNKNFLIFGILGGIIVVALLGLGVYIYFTSKPQATNETSSLPKITSAPIPQAREATSSVASVNGASDLDQLLIEVVQADNSLEKELTNLEKDSKF